MGVLVEVERICSPQQLYSIEEGGSINEVIVLCVVRLVVYDCKVIAVK